jgi:hypothetical protein
MYVVQARNKRSCITLLIDTSWIQSNSQIFTQLQEPTKFQHKRILFGAFIISNEGNMKILYHKNIFHSANQITVSQVLQCTEFSLKPTAIGISTSTQLQESINGEKNIQFSYFF